MDIFSCEYLDLLFYAAVDHAIRDPIDKSKRFSQCQHRLTSDLIATSQTPLQRSPGGCLSWRDIWHRRWLPWVMCRLVPTCRGPLSLKVDVLSNNRSFNYFSWRKIDQKHWFSRRNKSDQKHNVYRGSELLKILVVSGKICVFGALLLESHQESGFNQHPNTISVNAAPWLWQHIIKLTDQTSNNSQAQVCLYSIVYFHLHQNIPKL